METDDYEDSDRDMNLDDLGGELKSRKDFDRFFTQDLDFVRFVVIGQKVSLDDLWAKLPFKM